MVVLFLDFWGTSILISIVAILIYIPSNSVCESHSPGPSSPPFSCMAKGVKHVFVYFVHYIFWTRPSAWWIGSKDFCPILLAVLHSGNCFLSVEIFNLMQSHLSILDLISWAIGVFFRNSLPVPISSSVFQ
jgi:hypothetical protein